ncbi:MAG: hypothetical protein AAGF67_18610 [Verrucomicrobiota bacterium]
MKALSFFLILTLISSPLLAQNQIPSAEQLAKWLKRFPEADGNGDGTLTLEEATDYRKELRKRMQTEKGGNRAPGAPRTFEVDPRWAEKNFPENAVSFLSPEEIAAVYAEKAGGRNKAVTSFEKPTDGAIRIVGTGHSFMAPGYRTFPQITRAAGFEQPLFTHTSGGMTGSARYKWEQENGIFEFEGDPTPKLLASIANADWEAMMWGPYFQDKPEYYSCWIDFCLKYHPDMKFYLSDAWIQLYQMGETPKSEDAFTDEVIVQMGKEKQEGYIGLIETLRESYPDKVFILPTSDAMTLAARKQIRGELPGVEGMHRAVGGKERSLWRDPLGHLGPGFDRLEGYVFYATIYGQSPELIEGDVDFGSTGDFPGEELDRIFRKIAWEAVINHPFSGVTDTDGDGKNDS